MIKVKFEKYWDEQTHGMHENKFKDLNALADWIFGQMRQNYTENSSAMKFPIPENFNVPYNIEFMPAPDSETIRIYQIENSDGIIFSSGQLTLGYKHWTPGIKAWLTDCEKRRRNLPPFKFVNDQPVDNVLLQKGEHAMEKGTISISPVTSAHASCGICLTRNYQTTKGENEETSGFVQDLYEVHLSTYTICLCPRCLSQLKKEITETLNNRSLPEAYAIIKGSDFSLQICSGKKEILCDGRIRVHIKNNSLVETTCDFSPGDAKYFVFDNVADAIDGLTQLKKMPK